MARPTMTIEHEPRLDDDPMMRAATSLGALVEKSSNLTVTQERSLFGDIVTAQPIRVPRNEADILKRIDILAAGAGARWFYRYPVKNRRKGTTEHIEGPTVKCTDAVLMRYKNAAVESRTLPLPNGDFICYSRFCDWENGVSITMGQLVPKGATLGGEDDERRLQIAHNVGQSKSRRNVCVAALGEFVQRGFTQAKRSLAERIGRDINKSRGVIVEELNKLGVPNIVARVEQVYARKVSDWLAGDIASVYAELQAIDDGFSSIDETWPLPAPPEPRRSDVVDKAGEASGAGDPSPKSTAEPGPAAASEQPASSPPVSEEDLADEPGPVEKDWRVPEGTMGQDAIIDALEGMAGVAGTEAELDEIERVNAERIAKITGTRRAALNQMFEAQRLLIKQAAAKP